MATISLPATSNETKLFMGIHSVRRNKNRQWQSILRMIKYKMDLLYRRASLQRFVNQAITNVSPLIARMCPFISGLIIKLCYGPCVAVRFVIGFKPNVTWNLCTAQQMMNYN